MKQNHFFPYAKQSISDEDIQEVADSLKQELITRGSKVLAFEQKLAEYCGARFCVCMSSATTALIAAFQAARVCSADRFITTPNSFIATTSAGMRLGAKPHFVDIEKQTGNIDLDALSSLVKEPPSRGRLIIVPVHFAGIAQDMQKLDRMIKTPDSVVIEDAAHAIGSYYPDGSKVGSCSYSHMTVFSFHAIKTITTGEGGAVTTNDEELYHRLLCLRDSGIARQGQSQEQGQGQFDPWYYEVRELSGNYHMTEMQAALGLSQLNRVDAFVEKRRQIVSWYRKELEGAPHITLYDAHYDAKTAYHLMCVQIDFEALKTTRTQFMEKLKAKGIGSQYHYIPLYRHPLIAKSAGNQEAAFPNMEAHYKKALSLPLYVALEQKDVAAICSEIMRK